MLRRVSYVLGVIVGVAAACSSYGSSEPNEASADGGSDASPPLPAGDDGPSPDDAAAEPDAQPRCIGMDGGTLLAFENFDEDGGWSSSWSASGPTRPTLEAPAFSPPLALASRCSDAGCAAAGPTLTRVVPSPAGVTSVILELELRIDDFVPETYGDVALLALGPDGVDNRPHIRLDVANNGASFVAAQIAASGQATGAQLSVDLPSRNAFHAIAIRIDYGVAPPSVSLIVDDTVVGSFVTSPPLPVATTSWQVRIGMLYTSSVYQPWTVRYDDVAFCGR